jgi:hypothetical protein
MIVQRAVAVIMGMLLFAVSVECADLPFQDDFSDGASSNLKWKASNDFVTAAFDGVCKVTNNSTEYSGYVYHKFTTKPSVFTVSCKVTRADATVSTGLATCFSADDYGCFSILLGAKEIYFYGPGDKSSTGVASAYVDSKVNVLKVSKSGATINVWVNDHFVKTYTDSRTAGGDIAFFSNPKSEVSFDDITMTDAFTEAAQFTEFTDRFDDAGSIDWSVSSVKGTATEADGKLKLKTENNDSAYVYSTVSIPLTSFTGVAEFSHHDGNTGSIYGLVLEGDGADQRATFAINANGKYGAAEKVKSFNLYSSQSIRGKAYVNPSTSAKTYYIDTLEIIKRPSSSEYLFVVNHDTLARVTGLDYTVLRAGVFCQDSLDVTVDNFSFKLITGPVSIKNRPLTISSIAKSRMNTGVAVIDPLGRMVMSGRVLKNNMVNGMYLTKGYQGAKQLLVIRNR